MDKTPEQEMIDNTGNLGLPDHVHLWSWPRKPLGAKPKFGSKGAGAKIASKLGIRHGPRKKMRHP